MSAPSQASRVFATAFAAMTATAFCFVLRALVIDDWGLQFSLTETQKGELLGVGLWPFALTIVLLSLLIDRIGFKVAFWFATACHVTGLVILLLAQGYWMLYVGTLVMALGNGAVEAAANPLVATVFRHDKPRWLNRLHAGWPGGLILGGLLAMALGDASWRLKVALMFAPIAVYAALLLRQSFPVSERVAAGVSYRAMLGEAGFLSAAIIIGLMMLEVGRVAGLSTATVFVTTGLLTGIYAFYARAAGRALYLVFVLLMIPIAITELSTDSWISSLMAPEMSRLGLQAGWVLVYTAAIMFVIRLFAGAIIDRITPLGALAAASAITACGLFLLAGSVGLGLLAAATLYGIGKSFFWGTTLAVASEQFPKGGAVTVNVIAAAGMLAAGILGSVMLGAAQDSATMRALQRHDAAHGTQFAETYLSGEKTSVFGGYRALDAERLARAPATEREEIAQMKAAAKKDALRDIALFPVALFIAYLGLIVFFRRRGGYKPVVLSPVDVHP